MLDPVPYCDPTKSVKHFSIALKLHNDFLYCLFFQSRIQRNPAQRGQFIDARYVRERIGQKVQKYQLLGWRKRDNVGVIPEVRVYYSLFRHNTRP